MAGLRIELETRVLATAGVQRPVTSECDTEAITPSMTCRVTLVGQTVTDVQQLDPELPRKPSPHRIGQPVP